MTNMLAGPGYVEFLGSCPGNGRSLLTDPFTLPALARPELRRQRRCHETCQSDQTNIVTRLCCGQTQPGFLLKIDATVLPWEKIVDRGRHKLLWLDICMKSKTFAKQFVSSDASLWNNASSTPSDDHPPKWNYRFQVVCHDHISRHITPRITDRFSNFRPKERFSKVILKYRDWAAA